MRRKKRPTMSTMATGTRRKPTFEEEEAYDEHDGDEQEEEAYL